MKYLAYVLLLLPLSAIATQWQPPEPVNGLDINGLNLNSNNTIMYGAKWHDGYWRGDSCYYIWNGSSWIWGDWVQGDVNTTEYDDEPFITYDGQHLYFQRWLTGNPKLYMADWNGSQFVNSRQLNSLINTGDTRYPSLTQDGQKLYYSHGKIYEATWSGSDWVNPILLPPEVNEGGGNFRWYVTITPDGNEIYFTGAGSYPSRLAFSQKIGGVWQQWQYCDYNINPPGSFIIQSPAFTYSAYSNQYLYFTKNVAPYVFRSLRSPVSVEPASLGQIKANYKK